jgi:hypothetical protein
MLCGGTVAVCCVNRTEHTDTLCGQNAENIKSYGAYIYHSLFPSGPLVTL